RGAGLHDHVAGEEGVVPGLDRDRVLVGLVLPVDLAQVDGADGGGHGGRRGGRRPVAAAVAPAAGEPHDQERGDERSNYSGLHLFDVTPRLASPTGGADRSARRATVRRRRWPGG